MTDFTNNITICTRFRGGNSETYFIYQNFDNYIKSLPSDIVLQINKDKSVEYDIMWDSFWVRPYNHKSNKEIRVDTSVFEEFCEKYAIFKCRELLKNINCDCLIPDFSKTPE